MREILFRGKRIDTGEWVQGDLLQNLDAVKIREQEAASIGIAKSFCVDPATVGQYTGLKDIGGVQIFEGDVVDILCEVEETGTVEWDVDTARFVVSAEGFVADFDYYHGRDLEVTDNILDHSEEED